MEQMNQFEPFKIAECECKYNEATWITFTLVLNSFIKYLPDRVETSWSLGFKEVFLKTGSLKPISLIDVAEFDPERAMNVMEFLDNYILDRYGQNLKKYVETYSGKKSMFRSIFG